MELSPAIVFQDRSRFLAASRAEFQCGSCRTIEYSLGQALPEGWINRGGAVRCGDCAPTFLELATVPAEDEALPPKTSGACFERTWPRDLDGTLASILGLKNWETGPAATAYRQAGFDVPKKAESEQAFVLHRYIALWIEHGDDWRQAARADLEKAMLAAPRRSRRTKGAAQ